MPRQSWKTIRAIKNAENVKYKIVKIGDHAGYEETDRGIAITTWVNGDTEPRAVEVRITWKQLAETMARHWKIQRARRHK